MMASMNIQRNALEALDARARELVVNQRTTINDLSGKLELAERQVRDLARDNDRLRREIAMLRSGGQP